MYNKHNYILTEDKNKKLFEDIKSINKKAFFARKYLKKSLLHGVNNLIDFKAYLS